MKNYLPSLLSLLLVVASLSFFSCNDKDDDPMATSLFDKWWYANDITADIYISSNGNFEHHSGNPTDDSFFGEWTWEDEGNKIMKVDYFPGQGTGQPTLAWLRFLDVTASSMTLEQSLTGEAGSYVGPFEYTLVE